jgi:hypothetical protein
LNYLYEQYNKVRQHSLNMIKCLANEAEFYAQVVPEVSPAVWNLGHTTWFFDAAVLGQYARSLGEEDSKLWYYLNSYYKGAGKHVRQACRGAILIDEVSLASIYKYRENVDAVMLKLIKYKREKEFTDLVTLGIHHEQQHQELYYAEVLRNRFERRDEGDWTFFPSRAPQSADIPLQWVPFAASMTEIGNVEGGFGFDNEYGVHKAYINPFAMMNRPVTNGEFSEFIEDGGYENYAFWLAEAWDDSYHEAHAQNGRQRYLSPSSPVLGKKRRYMARIHPAGLAKSRSPCAAFPRELFRGNCLCQMEKAAGKKGRETTYRDRMGARRQSHQCHGAGGEQSRRPPGR